MKREDLSQLFDEWAAHYDQSVQSADGFPFSGYEQVLNEIVRLAAARCDMLVLDLGTGTGNLAKRFATLGCAVWGTDFSSDMLDKARVKLPQARFVQADLLGDWAAELNQRFDRVVSAYVFHEFELLAKINLLERIAREHLAAAGRIIIGDIAFPTVQTREQAHKRWANLWDEDEHYWAADEAMAACEEVGLHSKYSQISSCGGVFVIEPVRSDETSKS